MGQKNRCPGVTKTGVKKTGSGVKKHWAHLMNKIDMYFIFSIGGFEI